MLSHHTSQNNWPCCTL